LTTMSYTKGSASAWTLGAVALKGGVSAPDITPPTIVSATATGSSTVQVVFSEPVAAASAQTAANYGINNGVTVSSAVLGADTRTVTLTTSPLVGGNYVLTVNNVTDLATPPNAIAAGSQAAFTYTPPPVVPITLVSANSAVDTDGNSAAALTLTQGALANGYIVVAVSMWDSSQAGSISGAFYDNVQMTLLGTRQSATAGAEVYLFGLAVGDKPAGSYQVRLTGSEGINEIIFGVAAFSGVNQTASTGQFASNIGNAANTTTVNVNVPTASTPGDVVVDIMAHAYGTSTLDAGQTQIWRREDATDRNDGVSSYKPGASTTTSMSHTLSTNQGEWAIGAVALKPF
ncbi:MAG TPA: hypothetical protein VEC99_05450, partial [Clostridia bacterium]|nr:hypothetical protein [Clostridia bacterium]